MNSRYSSDTALSRTTRWCKAVLLGAAIAVAGTASAQVSVTATAGTMGPTSYTTVNSAFTAINAGTHQGAITVTVTANTTEPSTPVPLLRSNTPSSYSSILITCSGNVTVNSAVTPSATRGILEFVGADNVTIDGDDPGTGGLRNLTIQMATTTNSATHCVRLASNSTSGLDGADNNTIKNCNIIGGRNSATSTTTSFGILMSNSTAVSSGAYSSLNTVIDNNAISRCHVGISANGVSATYLCAGTIIRNNVLGSATSADNIGQRGILISYSASTAGVGSALIQNNDIRAGDNGTTGYTTSVAGIEVGTVNAGLVIERNNIHEVRQPSTSGYHAIGIYITGSTSTSGVTIRNNFIWDMVASLYTTLISTTGSTYGIYFSAGATNVNIDHNTIALRVNPTTGSVPTHINACVAATVGGVTIASFRNNILVNTLSSANSYGLYCSATTQISAGTVNNNDYYVPSGKVGYYNAAARTTLADWQTATSKDGAAINLNGPFVSSTNLHVNLSDPNASAFNGTGATGTGVVNDYDGDTRGTPPDIGADEFILLTCSAANGGTITPGTASACSGATYAMSSVGAEVGAGISYQWQVGPTGGPYSNVSGGTGANSTSYTTGVLAAGTYYYVLQVTCSAGPIVGYSNELALTVNLTPTATAFNNGPACVGGSVIFDGVPSAAGTYAWSGPNGFSSTMEDPTRSGLVAIDAGTYSFTVTVAGCPSTPATTAVVVNPAPTISSTTATPNPTCFNGNSQLQVSASLPTQPSGYSMTPSAGSFTPLVGATTVAAVKADDAVSGALPIGFTFNYAGSSYTTVRASSNGFLSFNASAGSTATNSLTAPGATQLPLIAPFWDDLDGTSVGTASYLTTGSAPNRVFTFEWLNWEWNWLANAAVISFQAKLFEADGRIEFVYRQDAAAYNPGATLGASIGLAGATAGNFLSLDGTGASPLASNSLETSTLSVKPATGQVYSFAPPALGYAWSPATFLSATNIANPVATAVNAASTAYTVTVTAAGCPSTGNVTLTTAAPITAATINGTPSFCAGGSTTLTAVPTDGAGPFTYAWNGPGGPAGTNAAQNVTVGGSWSVLVSDGCGGSVNPSISVTANPLPAPIITPAGPVSYCGSGPLMSSEATGNVWSPGGATTQNITATVLGNYTVTVTDLNGCVGTSAAVVVTVNPIPQGVSANASALFVCDGDMIDLTSTPGTPSTTILTENFNGAATGWTNTNSSTGGTSPALLAWTLRPNNYNTGGTWSVALSSNDASQFYLTNSDAAGSGVSGLTYLVSPSMDLTSYSDASLSFWHYYRDLGTTDTARVQVSTNGGASWTDVQVYSATAGLPTTFTNANISLNSFIGQANVQLRYRYRSGWDYGWAIDNVSVTGTPIPYAYSWSSLGGFASTMQNPTSVVVSPVPDTYTVTVQGGACSVTASVTVNLNTTDTDGDGIIDCLDDCDNTPGMQGDYCDVNGGVGPFLFGQINGSCACVAVPCTETVTMELRTDALSSQASWQILLQNTNQVVCQFSVPVNGITSPITENCCLPVGCYRLRVSDSGGDGFVSGGITGGYQLRESGPTGRRIIDNLGNFTNLAGGPPDVSAIANTYDNGAFCVPVGNDRPIFSSCDKLDWVTNKFIVATENVAVSGQYGVTNNTSGYEFWFFDPNGTYSFRRFRNHATSDGFGVGALRANHFRLNAWTNTVNTPHLPNDVLLNVRIRGRVAGVNQPFGPACLFKMDAFRAACPIVKLQDNLLDANYSCGVNRYFGGANSSGNRIIATAPQPVPTVLSSNVRYQFRFRNGEYPNPGGCIVRPPQTSPTLNLNWSAASGTQLKCNTQYDVDVRVSLDGGATWCVGNASSAPAFNCADPGDPSTAWGKVCSLNITTSTYCPGPLQGGSSSMATDPSTSSGSVTMYPNPNRGEQLYINLSVVDADVHTVSVDIYDLTGKRITARTIAVQDGFVTTVLDLNGDIANGMYMVNITAGEKTYTERLVIQK